MSKYKHNVCSKCDRVCPDPTYEDGKYMCLPCDNMWAAGDYRVEDEKLSAPEVVMLNQLRSERRAKERKARNDRVLKEYLKHNKKK